MHQKEVPCLFCRSLSMPLPSGGLRLTAELLRQTTRVYIYSKLMWWKTMLHLDRTRVYSVKLSSAGDLCYQATIRRYGESLAPSSQRTTQWDVHDTPLRPLPLLAIMIYQVLPNMSLRSLSTCPTRRYVHYRMLLPSMNSTDP